MSDKKWFVYIVKCSDETLYTGIATCVKTRVEEHNASPKGAKYTRARRPVELVYSCEIGSRSEAAKEEWRIKQLTRRNKELIIGQSLS
jgi:putative endonuclease